MDRTNTFGEAFLSISVGCARCHDHKYDPVSQENYYQLYSFLIMYARRDRSLGMMICQHPH